MTLGASDLGDRIANALPPRSGPARLDGGPNAGSRKPEGLGEIAHCRPPGGHHRAAQQLAQPGRTHASADRQHLQGPTVLVAGGGNQSLQGLGHAPESVAESGEKSNRPLDTVANSGDKCTHQDPDRHAAFDGSVPAGTDPEPVRNEAVTNPTASSNAEQIERDALLSEARELLPYLSEETPTAQALAAAIEREDYDAMSDRVHDAKCILNMLCAHCNEELDEMHATPAYCSQDCYWQDGGDL
jgi:hypothetical protein